MTGSVRALALAVEGTERQGELLAVNLQWVQTEYFGLLEDMLGPMLAAAPSAIENPSRFANFAASRPVIVRDFLKGLPRTFEVMAAFWREHGPVVRAHCLQYRGVKAAYGGDLFPLHELRTVPQAAVFADSIIVPDPVDYIGRGLVQLVVDTETIRLFFRHALAALALKSLAFAESEFPILVVAPGNPSDIGLDALRPLMMGDALYHLNSAIGSTFESIDAAKEWLRTMPSATELERRSINPDRLLADAGVTGGLEGRFRGWTEYRNETIREGLLGAALPDAIVEDALGRMGQATAAIERGRTYGAYPLTDAPRSWQYLKWKFEYDAHRYQRPESLGLEARVANRIVQSAEGSSRILGSLGVEALVALRQKGLLTQIREELRHDAAEMYDSDESRREELERQMMNRFQKNLCDAEKRLRGLGARRRKYLRFTVGSAVGNTALAIAGAATGNYWLTVAAAGAGVVGIPGWTEVVNRGRKLVAEGRRLQRSPIGFLVAQSAKRQ
ncbi:MAG: hypothetical protein ACKVVP_16515 [Chloroflexota bacterium]